MRLVVLALVIASIGCAPKKIVRPAVYRAVASEDAELQCIGGWLDENDKLHCEKIIAKVRKYQVITPKK